MTDSMDTVTGTRREKRLIREARNAQARNILLLSIFPVMVIAKGVVSMLPAKYFYDNNRILSMSLGTAGDSAWVGSYRIASDLFHSLNIADFTTMMQWSISLGVIFTFVAMALILRAEAPDILQCVFILSTIGLLNIYIFTIGKDIIQFSFFLVTYMIIMLPFDSLPIKLILSAFVLYWESTFFREYYVLIAALVLAVYVLLSIFRKRRELHAASVIAICILMLGIIYMTLLVSSYLMPVAYQQVMHLRSGYDTAFDGNIDSQTLISNWVQGDGLPIFMVNYVINAFRMMVPFELVLRGIYYLPFFIFQTMVTIYMMNLLRQINTLHEPILFLALCIFLGYILASFIFEPDFGSWVRHEAATFPILHLLVLNQYQKIPLTRAELALKRAEV